MNLSKANNLLEIFFDQYKKQKKNDLFFYQTEKQDPQTIFLEWLNTVNRKKSTWSETTTNIYKLSKILKILTI